MKFSIARNNKVLIKEAYLYKGFKAGMGLRFCKQIKNDEAILIERERESILDSTIDMLFVFFSIDVIWMDENKKIVDIKTARPFQLFSTPCKPAKYILEVKQGNGLKFKINDKLAFIPRK